MTNNTINIEKGFLSEISLPEALGRLFLPKKSSHRQDRVSLWLTVLSVASHICIASLV